MDDSKIARALMEEDYASLAKAASVEFDAAMARSDYENASECLLLQAISLSRTEDYENAGLLFEKFFKEFRDNLHGVILIRAKIYYARFLLRVKNLSGAKNLALEISTFTLSSKDPLLRCYFQLLKTEILAYENAETGGRKIDLIKSLESYLNQSQLISLLGQEQLEYCKILGEKPAIDLLLENYLDEIDFTYYLYWLEKAKLRNIEYISRPGILPLTDVSKDKIDIIVSSENKLFGAIEDYHSLLGQVFGAEGKKIPQTKSEGEYRGESLIPGKADEPPPEPKLAPPGVNVEIERAGQRLSRVFEEYSADIQEICQAAPVNDFLRNCMAASPILLQSMLGDTTAIINFYQSEDSLYAAFITSTRSKAFKIQCRDKELLQLAGKYLQAKKFIDITAAGGQIKTDEAEIELFDALSKIYQKVFEPFEKFLENKKEVIICPDGALYLIPLENLWDGFNFISAKYHIRTFPCIKAAQSYVKKAGQGFIPPVDSRSELIPILAKLYRRTPQEEPKEEIAGDYEAALYNYLKDKSFFVEKLESFDPAKPLDMPVGASQGLSFSLKQDFALDSMLLSNIFPNFLKDSAALPITVLRLKAFLYYIFSMNVECVFVNDLSSKSAGKKPAIESAGKQFGSNKKMSKNDMWDYLLDGMVYGGILIPFSRDEIDKYTNTSLSLIYPGRAKVFTQPVVHDNFLLFGGEDMCLYAINSSNGSMAWKFKTGDWIKYSPSYSDGLIFFGSMDKQLRAANVSDGRKKWDFRTYGWVVGTPRIKNGRVFFASKDKTVYILDMKTGKQLHAIKLDVNVGSPLYLTENEIVLSTLGGGLTAFCQTTYRKLWEKRINVEELELACSTSDTFIYADRSNKIVGIYSKDGRRKLEMPHSHEIIHLETDSNGNLITLDNSGHIRCFDLNTLKEIWSAGSVNQALSAPAVTKNTVWYQSSSATVVCVDILTGEKKLEVKSGNIDTKFITAHQGYIYLIDERGRVYRINLKSGADSSYAEYVKNLPGFNPRSLPVTVRQNMLGECGGMLPETGAPQDKKPEQAVEKPKKQAPEAYVSNSDIILPISIIENVIIACCYPGKVFGIDPNTLKPIWRTSLDGNFVHPPESQRGQLLLADDKGKFYVIDPKHGKIIWSRQVCQTFTSAPKVSRNSIFIGGDNGMLFCISLSDGSVRWKVGTGKLIKSAPLLSLDCIYIAEHSGRVMKLQQQTGKIIWTSNVLDNVEYDLSTDGENLVVTTASGIYGLSRQSGRTIWKYMSPKNEFTGPPVITGKYIYIGLRRGELNIIETKKSALISKIKLDEPISAYPIKIGEHLIVGTMGGSIYRWNYETGKLEVICKLREAILFKALMYNSNIYVVEGRKSIRKVEYKAEDAKSRQAARPANAEQKKAEEPQPEKNKKPEAKKPEKSEKVETADGIPSYKNDSSLDKADEESIIETVLKTLIMMLPFISLIVLIYSKFVQNNDLFNITLIIFIISAFFVFINYLQSENDRMKSMMSRFVPENILHKFETTGENTMEKEVTVLFQDLYNYTAITEILKPEELYRLLKQIDGITNEIVTKNGGEIMSYVGDAQMIAFNAGTDVENHSYMAVKTAIEVNRRVKRLGDELHKAGIRKFPFKLKMGFGINTGKALIGVRGGANRMEPFVIGDTTNIAVRLQKLTRELGEDMLASANTCTNLNGRYSLKDMGLFELKGKKYPIRVYSIAEPAPQP